MKDNFSTQADQYAQFRPSYPAALFEFILENVNEKNTAWDCATGNGQIAVELAKSFHQVYATDISAKQLENAPKASNIIYKIEQAEHTEFGAHLFDLITVAQAIHWFKFDDFFAEVKRILKPEGLFIAIGYGLLQISPELDQIISRLYQEILGKYWDEERRHIENSYQTIPFPFAEIKCPTLEISTEWKLEQLIGYLKTWSSTQHYIQTHQKDPINLVINDLKEAWGNEQFKEINFPLILRAGRWMT